MSVRCTSCRVVNPPLLRVRGYAAVCRRCHAPVEPISKKDRAKARKNAPEPLYTRNAPTGPSDITARRLSVRADSVNEEERSVEAVLSTENPAEVMDFRTFEVVQEVLLADGASFSRQLPMLENHVRFTLDAVLGSIRGIRVEDGQVVGRLVFARDDERADMVWNKVRQGHITDVSVGYRVDSFQDIEPGESATVEGRTFTAEKRRLRVTTGWTIKEASVVPIGADEFAKMRSDAGNREPNRGKRSMKKALRKYLEHDGLRADASDEESEAHFDALTGSHRAIAEGIKKGTILEREVADIIEREAAGSSTPEPSPPTEPEGNRSAPPVEPAPSAPAAPTPQEAARDAVAEERQRANRLREMGEGLDPELVDRAIADGWDETRASQAFLNAMRDSRSAPAGFAVHSRSHDSDCTERALTAAMVMRGGMSHEALSAYRLPDGTRLLQPAEAERAADIGYQYRDMSLIDLCREGLRLSGQSVPHGREAMIRAAVSTSSLNNIFTQTVGARLQLSYQEAGDSTVGWVSETDVPNFQSNERPRVGHAGALEKVQRGGTADHAEFSDTVESYKIARYGKKFVIDDQDIVDDRFNALLDTPQKIGAAARRLRPDLVYSILLANANMADGVALFHAATHGNLQTTAALVAATLKAAVQDMIKQTEDGVNLNIQPSHLIVPAALKFTAMQLIESSEIREAAAANGTKNVLESIATPVSDARLDNGVTDPDSGTVHAGSATTWFMAGAAGNTIEVGYLLGGGRMPQLRSGVLDNGQWGIWFDGKMDVGAKALDWRSVHKNTA